MGTSFETHHYPKRSRLEEWRDDIVGMRASNWPCVKIAQWLLEHHKIIITGESVRQFCTTRGIAKGSGLSRRRVVAKKSVNLRKSKMERKFDFDESKPINRWAEEEGE